MKKGTIMCVDDERHVLDTLMKDLEKRYGNDYMIEQCESAEEALELRQELLEDGEKISIYIVDHRMPGMKGIDFLKTIEDDAGKILLTAYADTQVAIDGINSKCLDFYILKTDYDTMLFSSIDHLLYAKENGIFVAHARTEEEREKALITQNTVFSEEHLELPYEKGIKIIGTSEYADFTDIFVAVLKRNIIGTTSISRRNESLADRFGTYFGLPLEEFYDISSLTGLDENLIQVRNAAVLPEYQNRRIAPMIWGEIYRVATMQEPVSKYAAILAGSEIRDAKKAKALYEKIKGTPMFDADKTVMLKKENELTYEGRLTEEDINDALLTKNLKLYAKMNFKFVGEPVYYPNFRMFDFPMLLKTDEIAEPYKTWFMKRKI